MVKRKKFKGNIEEEKTVTASVEQRHRQTSKKIRQQGTVGIDARQHERALPIVRPIADADDQSQAQMEPGEAAACSKLLFILRLVSDNSSCSLNVYTPSIYKRQR